MTVLEQVAREIDDYAGAAGDIHPPVGMVAVPVRLLAALRDALKGEAHGKR